MRIGIDVSGMKKGTDSARSAALLAATLEAHGRHLCLFRTESRESPVRWAAAQKADIYHRLCGDELPALHLCPQLATVWQKPEEKELSMLAERADMLLTTTEALRQQLLCCLPLRPEQLLTVGSAPAPCFRLLARRAAEERAERRFGLSGRWLFFCGSPNAEETKTLLGMLARLRERLGPSLRLVWAGRKESDMIPPAEGLLPLGFVPPAELPFLLRAATLFLYPGRELGFPLPLAEAMACGTPAAAAAGPATRELAAGAALLWDPAEPEHAAEAICRLWNSREAALHCAEACLQRSRRFRWEAVARRTEAAWELARRLG